MKLQSKRTPIFAAMLACLVLAAPHNALAQKAAEPPPAAQPNTYSGEISNTWNTMVDKASSVRDNVFSDSQLRKYLRENVIPEISKRFEQQSDALDALQKQVATDTKDFRENQFEPLSVDVQTLMTKVSLIEKNNEALTKSLAKVEANLNQERTQNQQLFAQAREREVRLHEMVKSDMAQQRAPDLAMLYQQLYPSGEFLLGTTISGMAASLYYKKPTDAQLLFRSVEHMVPQWSKVAVNTADVDTLTQLKAQADRDAAAMQPK